MPPPRLAALVPVALSLAIPLAVRAAEAPARRAAQRDPVGEQFAAATAALARDHASPRAIVPLAELRNLEDELPDLAPLASVYARVADHRDAPAEIRALARFRLAALERSRGNLQRSAAHLRRLGFVGAWRLVGPFDDEGKRAYDAVQPPEREVNLEARYAGKVREVGWRDLPPEAVVDGFVHVGAALRPAREVAVYALAVVEAPRDQRVQLWYGASGASKIWVNGALAIADPGYHPARIDQRGAWVTLRRGPNRILVKLCHEDGRMGFYLRLTDDRGDGLVLAPPPGTALPPPATPGERPVAIEGIAARLANRAAALARERGDGARRAEAEARIGLAVALSERQGADARERRAEAEARRAADLAPRSVEVQLLASSLDEDRSRRRARLEAALAVDPSEPRALVALAREELDASRPQAAVRLAAKAVAAAPRWAAARIALADAHDRAGLEGLAAREARETAQAFPTAPRAAEAAARFARRLGRAEEAAWLLRKVLALRFDDVAARGTLARLVLDRGDVDGSVALDREALRLDPSDVLLRLHLADVLAANGRIEEAEEAYAGALRITPEEADGLERRGRARLATGREADALQDLQRALELRPQNPLLKELVRSLEPRRERFEKPYILDGRAIAAAAPAPAKDEDALILAERKVTRVFPSGLSSTFNQVVVKVTTQRGVDAWRRQTIAYAPDRQEPRLLRARVLKPDGSVVESFEESERSASEPWYRLYYDTRARRLTFPALAPGDVLELAWRVDDVAGENLLSDYFGDITFVDEGERKLAFDYFLLVPASREIHASAPPGVAHTARNLDGVVEHHWSAKDVPRLDGEPMMPGWSEVARYVHVSTYASWDQVNRFYWGLVREQLRPGEEVRATARRIAAEVLKARRQPGLELTVARVRRAAGPSLPDAAEAPPAPRDRETELALVKAVHDFVVSQTRYVGLEFGIHGYKPYRVEQILERRFGDCKDKASLTYALLAALGIDSRLVLLRMRRLGAMPAEPASLAVFNHAILYVPRFDLWLDGTAAYSGSRELPGEDRGATVLVVNPDGPPTFGRIPDARPEDNRVQTDFDVTLGADGSASVKGESRIGGLQAPGYRQAYQTETERRSLLEQAFNRSFPGLEVRAVKISDLTRIEDDVSMQFELGVPRYAQRDGSGLRFTPFGAANGYAETYGSLTARRFDLALGDPMENRFTYRYRLPAGWTVAEAPEPARAETPFGAFEVRYRQDGGMLVADGHVTFRTGRVAAKDYPAFRSFLATIDRAFGRRVVVRPQGTVAMPAAAEGSR